MAVDQPWERGRLVLIRTGRATRSLDSTLQRPNARAWPCLGARWMMPVGKMLEQWVECSSHRNRGRRS